MKLLELISKKVNLHRDLLLWSASLEKPSEFRDQFAFDIYAEWRNSRTLKLHQDIEIINAALRKMNLMKTIEDLHFIIGSFITNYFAISNRDKSC